MPGSQGAAPRNAQTIHPSNPPFALPGHHLLRSEPPLCRSTGSPTPERTRSSTFDGTPSKLGPDTQSAAVAETLSCTVSPSVTLFDPGTPSLPPDATPSNRTLTASYVPTLSALTASNTSAPTLTLALRASPSLSDVPSWTVTTDFTESPLAVTQSRVPHTQTARSTPTASEVPRTFSSDPSSTSSPADSRSWAPSDSLTPSLFNTVSLPRSSSASPEPTPTDSVVCVVSARIAPPPFPHPDETLWLHAGYAAEPPECDPPDRVEYAWECERRVAGQRAGGACGVALDRNAPVVALAGGSLALGSTYHFTLTVSLVKGVRRASATAQVSIEPQLPAMVADLQPLGRLVDVRARQAVILNASLSHDPIGGPGDAYTFRWSACRVAPDGACATPDPDPFRDLRGRTGEAVRVVLGPHVPVAWQTWRFSVVYAQARRAPRRSAEARVELEFVTEPVYRVAAAVEARLDPDQPAVVAARVTYGGEPVPSGALRVAWLSPTLDLRGLSASGVTDRLSLAVPAAALAGPDPHTVTLTVAQGAVQQLPVLLRPRRPPALAAPPPPQCARFLRVSAADAVLVPGSTVQLALCYGAFQSPAGLYPLEYRLAVVYHGAEYPIAAPIPSGRRVLGPNGAAVVWRVPMLPILNSEPLTTLRFVAWVYDSAGVGRRFEDAAIARLLRLDRYISGPMVVAEVERSLADAVPGERAVSDIARAAVLLAEAGAGVPDDVVARLAQHGLARVAAQPDSAFADVQQRRVLGHAVRGLLHAGLRANATVPARLEELGGRGSEALLRFRGPVPGTDPSAGYLVDALSLLLQAATVHDPVLAHLERATAHVYAALSQALVAAQSVIVAAGPEYVRCDLGPARTVAVARPVCVFALGIARDEPRHLLRAAHRTPVDTDVAWGQPPDAAMQRLLELRCAGEYGAAVDLHTAAGPRHAALRAVASAALPPAGAVTQSLTLHAVVGLASAAAAIPIAGLPRRAWLALRFPSAAPHADAARCGYWDTAARQWLTTGLATTVAGPTTLCESAHLTDFALTLPVPPSPSPSPSPSLSPSPSPSPSPGVAGAAGDRGAGPSVTLIAGLFVPLLLLLLLCCLVALWCAHLRRKRKLQEQIHPEHAAVGPGLTLTPAGPDPEPLPDPEPPAAAPLPDPQAAAPHPPSARRSGHTDSDSSDSVSESVPPAPTLPGPDASQELRPLSPDVLSVPLPHPLPRRPHGRVGHAPRPPSALSATLRPSPPVLEFTADPLEDRTPAEVRDWAWVAARVAAPGLQSPGGAAALLRAALQDDARPLRSAGNPLLPPAARPFESQFQSTAAWDWGTSPSPRTEPGLWPQAFGDDDPRSPALSGGTAAALMPVDAAHFATRSVPGTPALVSPMSALRGRGTTPAPSRPLSALWLPPADAGPFLPGGTPQTSTTHGTWAAPAPGYGMSPRPQTAHAGALQSFALVPQPPRPTTGQTPRSAPSARLASLSPFSPTSDTPESLVHLPSHGAYPSSSPFAPSFAQLWGRCATACARADRCGGAPPERSSGPSGPILVPSGVGSFGGLRWGRCCRRPRGHALSLRLFCSSPGFRSRAVARTRRRSDVAS